MAPYVPPHRKETPLQLNFRKKGYVIPMIKNKYIVGINRKTGNTTFFGGGCGPKNNVRKCAIRELREEARQSMNTNLKNFFVVRVDEPKYRSRRELENNKRRGIKVITNYHVFSLRPKNSFETINKKFKMFVPTTNKEREIVRLNLKSLQNLKKNEKLWNLVRNKFLPRLI
jgi:hypothetical protein